MIWWTIRQQTYVRPLGSGWRFILVIGQLLLFGFIDKCGWCHGDTFAGWLEAIFVGTVLHHSDLTRLVYVTVFPFHLTGGQLCFDFEWAIGTLKSICVWAIFVVSIGYVVYVTLLAIILRQIMYTLEEYINNFAYLFICFNMGTGVGRTWPPRAADGDLRRKGAGRCTFSVG